MYRAYVYAKFERYELNILLRNLLHKFVLVLLYVLCELSLSKIFKVND